MKKTDKLGFAILALAIIGGFVVSFMLSSCEEPDDGTKNAPCAHTWVDGAVIQAATCVNAGSQKQVCSKCDKEGEPKTLDALKHEWDDEDGIESPATCTVPGGYKRTCTRTEPLCTISEIVGTPIPALTHEWDYEDSDERWEEVDAPDCTTPGLEKRTCENQTEESCDETRPIPRLGHEGIGEILATCSTPGNTGQGTCTRPECGQEVTEGTPTPLDPNNHIFILDKWTLDTTPATCTENAVDTQKCDYNTCNALHPTNTRQGREPIAENHVFKGNKWEETTPATCTEKAWYTEKCDYDTCQVLNTSNKKQDGNALGHNYNNDTNWQTIAGKEATWHNNATNVCGNGEEILTCTRCPTTSGSPRPSPCLGTQGLVLDLINGSDEYEVGYNDELGAIPVCIPDFHPTDGKPVVKVGDYAFNEKNITSVKVGKNVNTIGVQGFALNNNLTSIEISASIERIDNLAFANSTALKTVIIHAETPPTLGTNVFNNSHQDLVIYVPAASVGAYRTAWTQFANIIHIYGSTDPAVTRVTISDGAAEVEKGSSSPAFTAIVFGINYPVQTVTWSIVEADKHSETTISSGGVLTVHAEETKTTLTIRATSTVDNTTYGEAVVAVTTPGVIPLPLTWTAVSDTTLTSGVAGIAFGNGRFVAVSAVGRIAWSGNDGETWNAIQNTQSGFGTSLNNINGIAYGNGRFIAVGQGGKMSWSENGETWTLIPGTQSGFGTDVINIIAYGGGRFFAVDGANTMRWSTDGETWNAVTNTTFGTDGIRGIAYGAGIGTGSGRFVAVGSNNKIAWSDDGGETWTAVASEISVRCLGIAYGGGRFIAVSESYGEMVSSADGVIWNAVNSPFPRNYITQLNGIAYGGEDRFVAVGNDGMMAYSDNYGVTWTLISRSENTFEMNSIMRIAFGNGRFIVGGSSARMAYSNLQERD
ncbi:MAG: leucine-rich repeat protein [Treponema sp.]|jgi:hypothetical protein|nr:leucine-rich repeat protein [Treponema sp.]